MEENKKEPQLVEKAEVIKDYPLWRYILM